MSLLNGWVKLLLHKHFRLFQYNKNNRNWNCIITCNSLIALQFFIRAWYRFYQVKMILFLFCSTTTLLRSHLTSGEPNLKLWVWLLSYQLTLVQVKINCWFFCMSNSFYQVRNLCHEIFCKWPKGFFNKALIFCEQWEIDFIKFTVTKGD